MMTERISRTPPHAAPPDAVTASGGRLVSHLVRDQQSRWHTGDPVPVEAYLREHPSLRADADGLMDLICNEWVLRAELGETIVFDEYVRRFPDIEQPLRMQWEVRNACRQMSMPSTWPTQPPSVGTVSTPAPAVSELPSVPGYDVQSILGKGGMGVVYKARRLGLNRLVALKMLRSGSLADSAEQARFKIEAESVARLQHPNIVQIFDIGTWRPCESDLPLPYLSLEFVDGGSLSARLADGPLPPRTAAELLEILSRAMEYAHQRGIVHRDLKPGNVLLQKKPQVPNPKSEIRNPKSKIDVVSFGPESGINTSDFGFQISDFEPKITDFGLAKRLDLDSDHTRTGAVMGTPSYMAPEQAEGRVHDVSPATDVYALGAILYEMLTGRPPFKGTSVLDTLEQVKLLDPVMPRRLQPGVPRDIETICLKCLAKDQSKRYGSAGALADDLRRYLAGKPILAKPTPLREHIWKAARRRPGVAVLLAAILAVTVGGVAGILHQWRRAEHNAKEQRQTGYVFGINLIQQVLERDNTRRALELLDSLKPGPGQKDLRGFEWHYLYNVCHGEKLLIPGRGRAAISPDGRVTAGGGENGVVQVRDVDGREISTLQGHTADVTALLFSPDGTLLISAARDGLVKIWDWHAGVEKFVLPRKHTGLPLALAVISGGTAVASGGTDGRIVLWNIADGSIRRVLEVKNGLIRSLTASADGQLLAAATTADKIWLWDKAKPEADPACIDHGEFGTINDVALSPDGKLLVTAAGEKTIRLWDVATRKHVCDLKGHNGNIARVAFTANGDNLISGSWDRSIRVWDVSDVPDRVPPPIVLRGHTSYLTALSVDRSGRHIVSASDDGSVRLWDLDVHQAEQSLPSGGRQVHCLAHSPDGLLLAMSGPDGIIRVGNEADGSIANLHGSPTAVNSLAFRSDGQHVAAGFENGSIGIWDVWKHELIKTFTGHRKPVTATAYSPDGRLLASSSQDGSVYLWNSDGERVGSLNGHEGAVHGLAFHPDGKRLISVGADHTVRIWNLSRAGHVQVLRCQADEVMTVAFDSDGRRFATGGKDRNVIVWDAATGDRLFTLSGHDGSIAALTFCPTDSRRLASVGSEGVVRIWDLDKHQELLTLTGCPFETTSLAFSPTGTELVAGGGTFAHGQIKRWSAARR
jgi:WD40 repeat protein/serine/threonine protein kinase